MFCSSSPVPPSTACRLDMVRAKRHLAAYPKRIILIRHGEVSTQVGTQECLWVGGREGGYVSRYVQLLAQSTSGLIMCAKAECVYKVLCTAPHFKQKHLCQHKLREICIVVQHVH